MAWQNVLGHEEQVSRFRRCVVRGRLANVYLFVGPSGIGKKTFALALAKALLCSRGDLAQLLPCGACDSCRLMDDGEHPDVHLVARPDGKAFIPVELLIGDHEHRMRVGFCHHLGLRPYLSGRRVGIIDDADYLNEEGANCLLKTLEEPPAKSLLVLIGTSEQRQLPTIRSRCQVIRFPPLAPDLVREILRTRDLPGGSFQGSAASLDEVHELAEPATQEFRQLIETWLSRGDVPYSATAETLSFVDRAGTEAAAKRERAKRVIGWVMETLRDRIRSCPERAEGGAAAPCRPREIEVAADCLERCIEAIEHLDRNAHVHGALDAWLDDLHRLLRGS